MVILGQIGCGGGAMGPLEVEEGVSWALAEHRAMTVSEVYYEYVIRVPRDPDAQLSGDVAIEFLWSDTAGEALVIDFKDPSDRVTDVRANGVGVDWTARHDHVVLPAFALRSGKRNRIEVEFVAGDEALNRNNDFLYTLFVPDRAHFSLPLFDQPNLKARFSLTLEVPEGWVALANGEATVVTGDAGSAIYHFAETEPIPSYLFAFAVGEFRIEVAERAGRVLRMFHRETDAEKVARNREAIFDLHGRALDWLEDYTGIAYPFGKFDFALIPPFQYGGMEHPGAIFYREAGLMLEESATQAQQMGRASLIAHETAHMWFGDLVTMNWFDDVWTKEVFANFMASKIVQPSFPEVNHQLRFLLAHHDSAYRVDRSAGANPIRQPLENLNEAGTLYGPIIYQKAPIVMRQLERLVGEERFRDGLREYLHVFRYGNATWPELIGILDRQSNMDLAAWSAVWVEEPGRPVVTTHMTTDESERLDQLTVTQLDPDNKGRQWPQQLEVLLAYDEEDIRFPLMLDGRTSSVDAVAGRPLPNFVLPNATGVEYGRFQLDARSLDYLIASLSSIPDPLTRGIGWVTLWDGVLNDEVPVNDWMELVLGGLTTEDLEQNAERILGYLETTYWKLLTGGNRRLLAPRIEEVLWSGIASSGSPTLKAAYFRSWRSIVQTDDGVERMRRLWNREQAIEGLPLSVVDFTNLAAGLALREVDEAESILDEQVVRFDNPDRLARFVFVKPALSRDPLVREQWFESLRDSVNREREPWVLQGLTYLHHPLRAADSRRFVRPSLELLQEIQRTGDIFFPTGWLDATLGGHNSVEVAGFVRQFLESLPPDYPARLQGKIHQSADMLFRSSAIVGRIEP